MLADLITSSLPMQHSPNSIGVYGFYKKHWLISFMNSLYRFKICRAKEWECINGIQQPGSKLSYPMALTCYCANGPKHWTISITNCIIAATVRMGAEMTLKQIESLSPPIMKQVLPLVEQLPPLYMDLAKGRDDFSPKPEEAQRLIKSYYGISRNLLIKFKDDSIDETPNLAKVLCSDSAVSSMLDMSIRLLPGDHGLPLQQVPPAMADAVNRGSELFVNLSAGTPWETVAKEVSNTLGVESSLIRPGVSKDMNILVDMVTSWMASNSDAELLRPF